MGDNKKNDDLDTIVSEPESGSVSMDDIKEDNPGTSKKEKRKSGKEQQLKEELTTQKDQFMRLMAEYDNYRKRTEKEKTSLVSLGTSLALERLLPVLDTLEMAASAESKDPEYKKGVELTVTLFKTALTSLGISEIEAEGKPFDPNIHNCVATAENDQVESGIVVQVMQKGYMLNERVIRPSIVTVSA